MDGLSDEAYFHWTINDFETQLDMYGAAFVVEHCKIDNAKLFALYKALQARFVMENKE